MLVFVQLLKVDQGMAVARVKLQDFLERLERAVHESSVPEIQTQAEQYVGMLEFGKVESLEQRLMDVYRAPHLPLFAV